MLVLKRFEHVIYFRGVAFDGVWLFLMLYIRRLPFPLLQCNKPLFRLSVVYFVRFLLIPKFNKLLARIFGNIVF